MRTLRWVVPTHYRPLLVDLVVSNLASMEMPEGWDKEICVVAAPDDPFWDGQWADYGMVAESGLVGTKMDLGWRHSDSELVGICGDDDFLHPLHAIEAIKDPSQGVSLLQTFKSIVVDKKKEALWTSRVDFPPIGTGLVVERRLLEKVDGWPRVVKGVDHRFRDKLQRAGVNAPGSVMLSAEVLTTANTLSGRAAVSLSNRERNHGAWHIDKCSDIRDASPWLTKALMIAEEHGVEYLYGDGKRPRHKVGSSGRGEKGGSAEADVEEGGECHRA